MKGFPLLVPLYGKVFEPDRVFLVPILTGGFFGTHETLDDGAILLASFFFFRSVKKGVLSRPVIFSQT